MDSHLTNRTYTQAEVDTMVNTARAETWKAAAEHVRANWLAAYPVDIFPEPPVGEHGTTVDACSARMGRHMATKLIEKFEAKKGSE